MQCIQNGEITDVLTRYAKDASVHVLALGNISYQVLLYNEIYNIKMIYNSLFVKKICFLVHC